MKLRLGHLCLALLWLMQAQYAFAHEVRPGFIDLVEQTEQSIKVTWKSPIRAGVPLSVTPSFPKDCEDTSQQQKQISGSSVITSWVIHCEHGLAGQAVGFPGLESTLTDIILRYQPLLGEAQTHRAVPERPLVYISATPTRWSIVKTYFYLGVEHISSGIDHLLFVLALILLIHGNWQLVKAITAFTIAHSITLAVSTLGHFTLAQSPVESVIALSIVFLANELALAQKNQPHHKRLSQQSPWMITFCFGLLHGLGFAGALREIGLPQDETPLALLMFNLGVEAGQLIFVFAILMVLALAVKFVVRSRIEILGSYIIGATACFWLAQRVFV